jgi:predicted phage terminase large subunit-like protein
MSSWGGDFAISGQFQQRPAPRGGGMFKRDWIKVVDLHEVPSGGQRARGWDLAGSRDGRAAFTVGARLERHERDGRAVYYVTDIVRDRLTPGQVRDKILACAVRDGRSVTQDLPQDPGQAGLAQKHDLAGLLDGYSFSITPESGSKEDRARPLAAQAEAGNLHVVRAPWTEALIRELTTFPAGAYKDQVDALSRAYARLLRSRRSSVGGSPVVVEAEPSE